MGFLETMAGRWLMTMGIASLPVLELRAAIPAGVAAGLPPWQAFIAAVIGSMLPVPLIMLLIRRVFAWLRGSAWWGPRIDRLEERARRKGGAIRRYCLPGLVLLAAIPLPGAGAWTGALVAELMDIRMREAIPAIFVGVVIAGALITALTYGVSAMVT